LVLSEQKTSVHVFKKSFVSRNFAIAHRERVVCHFSPFQIQSAFDLTSDLIPGCW